MGRFSPAEADPDLSAELVDRHRTFLETQFPDWGSYQSKALLRQRGNGGLRLHLWRSRDSRSLGLLWTQASSTAPRVHGVWIEPAGPDQMSELLEDVAREWGAPPAVISDVLPGVPDADGFFGARGYWHRAKVLMRREAGVVDVPTEDRPHAVRSIAIGDLPAVVQVYAHAYSDRPGEFWTWSVPNAIAEAESDVYGHREASGGWAASFLPTASFVWEEGGRILGAVLVDAGRSGTPFVADLVVEPTAHRRGIGRALLASSIVSLTRDGPRPIELCAIRLGAPYRLYTRLGFSEVPPPKGRFDGYWIRGASPF